MKRTRLRRRSPKMTAAYVKRRVLVAEQLEARPWCEAGHLISLFDPFHRCAKRATELHEPKTRARGGSILEVSNTVSVCRRCHDWIGDHPRSASSLGLLRHSWD